MIIETGLKYRMVKFPRLRTYAHDYCTEGGLYLGCVCELIELKNFKDVDSITYVIKSSKDTLEVGSEFFRQHFIRDLRTENLNVLLELL